MRRAPVSATLGWTELTTLSNRDEQPCDKGDQNEHEYQTECRHAPERCLASLGGAHDAASQQPDGDDLGRRVPELEGRDGAPYPPRGSLNVRREELDEH